MEYRKSQWTENISSLLRKTEMNLIRIQTPFHEEMPRSYNSVVYSASFYDNPQNENPLKIQNDHKEDSTQFIQQEINGIKSSLEKIIYENVKNFKNDLTGIEDKVTKLEISEQSIDNFQEEIRKNVYNIEKKCLAEIKRIENSGKGWVSENELKNNIENLKNSNLVQLKKLEIEIQALKNNDSNAKEQISEITEEKLREISKQFVEFKEFSMFKESILKENDQKLKDFEIELQYKIEDYQNEVQKKNLDFEDKLEEINRKYEKSDENIFKKLQNLEKKFVNFNSKSGNDIKSLKSNIIEVNGLINKEEIINEISLLKTKISALPKKFPDLDLSNLLTKIELNVIADHIEKDSVYNKLLLEKIEKIEKKIEEIENRESESDEIEIDLPPKQNFIGKAGGTFGKNEEENAAFTKIFINDLGDSDSESHGYVSPHTSPLNQLSVGFSKQEDKKSNQFDFKKKTDFYKNSSDLIMIDEKLEIESKAKAKEIEKVKSYEKIEKNEKLTGLNEEKNNSKKFMNELVTIDNENLDVSPFDTKKNIESTVMSLKEEKNVIQDNISISNKFLKKNPEAVPVPIKSQENVLIPSEEKINPQKSVNPLPNSKQNVIGPEKLIENLKKPENQAELKRNNIEEFKIPQEKNEPVTKKIKEIDLDDQDFDIDLAFNKPKPIGKIFSEFNNKALLGNSKNANSDIEKNPEIILYIDEFTEKFIEEELNTCCQNPSIKTKSEAPSLKIPQNIKGMQFKQFLDSPSVSSDRFKSGSDPRSDFSGDIDLPY